jgi:DNA (cytosine-5)-methyltransferase 1
MRYFSMFSGIGGFEKALTGHECVGYSEIDKHAIKIYEKHFPKHRNYGDATRIQPGDLPDFDLLCAGFPCQAFSIAGKRRGFEDTRGTMFFEIARIVRAKRPKYLLLENVKGLLSHADGQTFHTIIRTLSELGYVGEWQVLNSKDFGVPQNRERVFIIGHLGGFCGRKVFPVQGYSQEAHGIQREAEGKRPGIPSEVPYKGRCDVSPQDRQRGVGRPSENGLIEVTNNQRQGRRIYSEHGLSATIAAIGGGQGAKTGLYDVGTRVRRLTPTECERLQSFPDGWTEGLSDSARYKCLGNSVTVNVIEAIISSMFSSHSPRRLV